MPKNQTYDFGEADAANGFGYEISNGRIVEKYQRRNIFFQQHKTVRIWRLNYHEQKSTNYKAL